MSEPTSTKPYLLRALYEWCVDNGFTPYISVVVDASTRVPMEYVRDGEIVLNIGPLASNRLQIGQDRVEFAARFGGVARELSVPIEAIKEIFAKENGQGMAFSITKVDAAKSTDGSIGKNAGPDRDDPATDPPKAGGRPALRRVK
ncbi:MAG: ClpXP protease specificity-enhancing factor [Burkholderiales bacterium]